MNTTTAATKTKKLLTDRVKAKIEHLNRLIQHKNTKDEERDAAKRALARIAEAYEFTATPSEGETMGPSLLWNYGAWAGEKYWNTNKLTVTEIAKLIREDLKLARKVGRATTPKEGEVAVSDPIGDAPCEIKFSVVTHHYTSIEVTIKNIPEGWGWTMQPDEYRPGAMIPTATPAMTALFRAVEEIHAAYNYCNSDITTDYFERRYWGSVTTEQHIRIPQF